MASSAFQLEEFIRILDSWGLTDVLLPFLLYFVVIFAILEKSKILGADKRKYNLVFALVVGLLVVIPHVLDLYPPERDVVAITNAALPQVSVIAVAIVMVMILIGLFGGEAKWAGGSMSGWIAIIAFIIVLIIFGGAAGWWGSWSWVDDVFGRETVAIIVMLLVFAIIVWWVTSSDEAAGKNAMSKFGESVSELFGGKSGGGGGHH
ncbi:hypothetical protein HYU14_06810 [Candidatus Woesearchaeota archaeon]|nr:hypothetical protein [Candidatus Woesearchaeota archaeon]